ncbi:MAG: hypothetical protein ACD_83C00286G0001 [uncultured bacterium]|nr:MAG: hypothetical protein ACD_83C00286G0001 [uncultured bacterium]
MPRSISIKQILKYLFTEGPGVFIILAVWSLRQVIANPFILGQKFDWYLPLFNLRPLFSTSFYSWSVENTGSPVGYYSAWIGDFLFGLGGWLGISPNIFIPLFLIFILTLAGWGMHRLLRFVHVPWFFALLAGIFYMSSPVVYIRIIIGFTLWLLAYALAPLILLLYLKIIHEKDWLVHALWTGLLLGVATVQIQFFLMISFMLLIVAFTKGYGFRLRERLKRFFVVIAFSLVFELPWLLVLFFRGLSTEVSTLSAGSAVYKSVTALPHSFLRTLFLNEHHITYEYFDVVNHQLLFFWAGLTLVLLLALGTVAFWRKISFRWLILIVAPVSFLITILPHPHFAWLYQYLFNTSKLVNIFREVYHAQFLSSFIYAVAIGSVTGAWWRAIKKISAKIAIILVSFALVGLFCHVSLKGDFGSFGSKFDIIAYRRLWLKNQQSKQENRVWYPLGLGFVQDKNDNSGASNGDVIARSINQPFLDEGSSVLNQPNNLTNIRNTMLHDFMLQKPIDGYLSKLSVNQIIERRDLVSLNLGVIAENNQEIKKYWQPKSAASVINSKDWSVDEFSKNITIYQKNKPSEIIYPATKAVLSSGNLTDLSGNRIVVFLADNQGDKKLIDNLPLLEPKSDLDLMASLVSNADIINLTKFTDQNEKATEGWSQGRFSWWYRPEFSSPIRPFIVTRREDNLKISLSEKSSGYYQTIIKVWHSPKGGLLSLGVGDQSLQIDTTSDRYEWRWHKIDDVVLSKENKDIEINNIFGEQAVGELILLPERQISQIDSQIIKIKNNNLKIKYFSSAKVSSTKRISPTRHQVSITSNKPFLLVFAEKYDPHWILKINGQKIQPIIVNGWANGYWIDKPINATGKIVYTLQIWYLIGLILAALGVCAPIVVKIILKRRLKSA